MTLDRCHFDAGQVGVRASGSTDLLVRDCTIAASEPAVWLDNGRSSSTVAADVRFHHVSVLAGEPPVFRFEGTEPRVWVDDSVFAAAGEAKATLVVTDQPDSLVWRGRGNLYARVGTFLMPADAPLGREAIRDPLHWNEGPDGVRETGSAFESRSVWAEADPAQILAQGLVNPARAFRLAANHPGAADIGSRQDPFGSVAAPSLLASNTNSSPTASQAAKTPTNDGFNSDLKSGPEPAPVAEPATPPSTSTVERRTAPQATNSVVEPAGQESAPPSESAIPWRCRRCGSTTFPRWW